MSPIEWIESAAFRVLDRPAYVDVNGLFGLFASLAWRAPLILVGPKGIAKTTAFQAWAADEGSPIITFDCSEDVRRGHLLGSFVLRGDTTPFVCGPITTAIQVANDCGQAILALEEINALSPQCQKVLNAITDWRQAVAVPECGRVFRLEPRKKLWVVGTMNTTTYAGVNLLNEDLKSRFRLRQLEYPTREQELAIIAELLGEAMPAELEHRERVLTLAHETRQTTLEYALSTRDVVQLLEDAQILGTPAALDLVLGKFEGDDRVTVRRRINSIFV